MFKSKSIVHTLRNLRVVNYQREMIGMFGMRQFHTQHKFNNLTTILKESAGLNRKELDLFEQLRLDESDLDELKNQISETSYQSAMERFHRIVNNKCVFIERDETVDLSKFSIKLVEFASAKVLPTRKESPSSTIPKEKVMENIKETIPQETQEAPQTPQESIQEQIDNVKTIQQEIITEEEPSSISALAQESQVTEEEEEETTLNTEKSQFQLPTESYLNWDKETTLYVMKGVIRKGGAGMKAKQITCLQQFELNGLVLESVRIALEKESKQVVCEKLIQQLAIPKHKPTPSIASKIVDWVANRK